MRKETINVEYRARFRKLLKEARRTRTQFIDDSGVGATSLKKIGRGEKSLEVDTLVRDTITRWFNDRGEKAAWLFEHWQPRQRPDHQPATGTAAHSDQGRVALPNQVFSLAEPALILVAPESLFTPRGLHQHRDLPDLPDILTPGSIALLDGLTTDFPKETIERWAALGEEAIVAVEHGDFAAHVTIGQRIIEESAGVAQIRAAGHYFKAEGQRLLASLNKDQQVRGGLLESSLEDYARAGELYPHNPRAIRGAASVLEARGDLGQSLDLYERAKGMSLEQAHTPSVRRERLLVLHEILRVTRHEIHCISEIRRTSPASAWRKVNKEGELRGFLVHSGNKHDELLAGFRSRPRWYLLEWFMAMVFFGKVWGDLGDSQRMINSLLRALKVRRLLIAGSDSLTAIEKANLRWWMDAALRRERTPIWGSLVPNLDAFEDALHNGTDREILGAMDDLIALITVPGENEL